MFRKIIFACFIKHKVSDCLHLKPLNAELNPIRHLLALVAAHYILYVSSVRVNVGGAFSYCRGRLVGVAIR